MSDEVMSVSIEAGEKIPAPTGGDKPQRPEYIPEKFWDAEKGAANVEAMAKAYAEAEKKISTKAPDKEPAKEIEKKLDEAKKTDPGANLGITQEQAKEKVAEAGLDMAALSDEFNREGKLSDETYQKLEAAKIPRAMADAYIEGQKALAVQAQAKVFEAIGGKDVYAQAIAWAKANLPADEIEAYDRSLRGKSLDEIKVQAKGLVARFKSEAGPEFVLGGDAGAGVKPYASFNELVADQRKPEYKNDPDFRAKVRARLAVSNI